MARRNTQAFSGSVSWTENQNATKQLEVPIHGAIVDDAPNGYLLTVKNGSAVVSLTVALRNSLPDIDVSGAGEIADLDSFTVTASQTKSIIVVGWPLGIAGDLLFTKSAATAAAFSAYVELRRA
jgi:hypothetical protein